MEIKITTPGLGFSQKTDTFSGEISELRIPGLFDIVSKGLPITLHNPESGNRLKMTRVEVHQDSTGEDTYGWLYHGYNSENGRNVKLLIIND